jgi:hypothetical protein
LRRWQLAIVATTSYILLSILLTFKLVTTC